MFNKALTLKQNNLLIKMDNVHFVLTILKNGKCG